MSVVLQSLSAKLREKRAAMCSVCGCDEPTGAHNVDSSRSPGGACASPRLA